MSSASLWQQLEGRGLIAQHTGQKEILELFDRGPTVFYLGIDPTGDSLHVGHLTPLMLMRHLVDAGHRPLLVVGGGTAMVGDPTGKTESRPILSREAIAHNTSRIAAQIESVLGKDNLLVIDNATWLMDLNYIEFLREVGRHFSVNRMLSAESVKLRLESHLSFLEFNYPLLQAYDFMQLRQKYDCMLQIGGDDQWGNILAGVDLTRRALQKRVEAMTVPLLTTANGTKMGKTAKGAIWLAAEKLTPNDFYQYFVQVDDADVIRFLKIYTLLPLCEIEAIGPIDAKTTDVSLISQAKHLLAFEVTALLHGAEAAQTALAAAQSAFGAAPIAEGFVPSSTIARGRIEAQSAIPSLIISSSELAEKKTLVDILIQLNWTKSKNEARRLITQGGVRIDEETITDANFALGAEQLNEPVLLRAGKRRVCRLLQKE